MPDGNTPNTPKVYEVNTAYKTSSYLIPRAQMSAVFGQSFGGRRNVYDAFGYPMVITPRDILIRYERGGIARRIVDAYPDATWGAPPTIISDNAAFTAAWDQLVNEQDVWSTLHRLDTLSRLGQYAVLLLGTDKPNLDRPLKGARKISFFQPFGELSARIQSFNTNPQSERFNKPEMYQVYGQQDYQGSQLGYATPTGMPMRNAFMVHFSRIVHVAQKILENDTYGVSTLIPVWNYLIDLEKIGGAAAENFWTSANRGMQLDVDKDMEMSSDDATALSDEVDEYVHGLRRVLRTRGIKVNPLGGDVSDPRGPYSVTMDLISGATGIPRRVLLGTESGHLASTQDKGNWAERIEEYRTLTATPYILDPFIWSLVNAGLLPDPGVYEYRWPDAYRLGPLERGQQSAQTSRTASNLVRAVKDWQSVVIQRKQLSQMPTPQEVQATADKAAANAPPAPVVAPGTPGAPTKKGPFGRPIKANLDERTPVEDALAHQSSGNGGGSGNSGSSGGGKPSAGPVTIGPANMPVTLPDLPDMILSTDEIRAIIGLSTDNRVLSDQQPQVIKGRKKSSSSPSSVP